MGEVDRRVIVRRMQVSDLPHILEIERRSFPTPWSKSAFLSELLENRRAHYLVAEVEGRAVGYIGLWLIAGEGHITNIAVHPDWRQRGIGRLLLQSMMQFCREHDARRMTLEVRRSNRSAQHLYESMGFVYCGTRKGYYRDNGEDAFIMWCDLDEPLWDGRSAHDEPLNEQGAKREQVNLRAREGR